MLLNIVVEAHYKNKTNCNIIFNLKRASETVGTEL